MTENQKYIIALLKAAVFQEQPPLPHEGIDWGYIWSKGHEQNIIGLLADSVLRLPAKNQPSDADKWNEALMHTLVVMGHRFAGFEYIRAALEKNNIVPLCLKGIVIKDFYPVPELRTMGDFDILIDKQQRSAAERIFEESGYSLRRDTLFTEIDRGDVHGEIFISLEDDFRNEPELWDSVLKENTAIDESGRLVLTPTYELAYVIVHAAKHITREGSGIRNIADVALLMKNKANKINLDEVRRICASQGYERIFDYIMSAVEDYFGIAVQTEKLDSERFVEYTLCYGVFGRQSSALDKQVAKTQDTNISVWRRMFFPPCRMIWHKYRYLKKAPYLLPVAWVHRFITGVFVRKHSVSGMLRNIKSSVKYSNEREKWLNELGLM